jgi:hypothetical protein
MKLLSNRKIRTDLFKYIIWGIIGITSLDVKSVSAQQHETIYIEKTLTRYDVDSSFLKILDSLISEEKKCFYYNPRLIWSIGVTEIKPSCYIINITMQSEINKDHQYLGYFKLKETLFMIPGSSINGLFIPKEENELEFTIMELKNPKDYPIGNGMLEDYSTWIYIYRDSRFILKESYPLPCK